MPKLEYTPQNVCSRKFEIEYEDGIITSCHIIGGCSGNLQGISRLITGRKIDEVIHTLEGIKCPGSRTRQTSCPDQISLALKSIK